MAEIRQCCANEDCSNTVPAQVGPRLCPACMRNGMRLLTEADAERRADTMVWQRLGRDRAYQFAENAEAAAEAEERIGHEVWAELERKYVIA